MSSKRLGQAAVAAALIAASPGALAYLDPGTGSMLLQLLIAGVLGALFTLKMYWYRVKVLVSRMLGKEPPEPPAGAPDRDPAPPAGKPNATTD